MPLRDVRVVDISIARAGPTAVRQLADWGASVVRIEAPKGYQDVKGHTDPDYVNLHRNKRLVTLDLKRPEGQEIFHRLVDDADVVVENFRPPVKERLGIDYASLAARNPRLVYGSVSGYGQDGPYADKGAVDQVIQGMGGLMSITGQPGGGPVRAGIAISDMAAGHQLAIGILVALHERHRSGLGQWVQVSLLEAMISFLDFQAARWTVAGEVAGQAGNDHPTVTPMGTFETADGYLNIAAAGDRLWQRFCEVVGAPELLDEPDFRTAELRHANRDRVNARVQEILRRGTRATWVALLDEAGVPCGPVNTIDEVFADPQVQHLGMAVPVEHPTWGPVSILRQPVTTTRTPAAVHRPSPLPGQHTDEVLGELGYSPAEIASLRERGVV